MTTMYVLDIPENVTVAELVQSDPLLTVARIGPYYAISRDGEIVIDRRKSGCRHAVWYSLVAGVERGATIVQHDKDALRVCPGTGVDRG